MLYVVCSDISHWHKVYDMQACIAYRAHTFIVHRIPFEKSDVQTAKTIRMQRVHVNIPENYTIKVFGSCCINHHR